MRRHARPLVPLFVALVACAVIPSAVERQRPKTFWDRFGMVEQGMTADEVDELLGTPDRQRDGGLFGFCGVVDLPHEGATWQKQWLRPEGAAQVAFDPAGRVRMKSRPNLGGPPRLTDRVRDWVRQWF